ncbi:hypothetical protein ACIBEF_00530 [Micromonospora sp. NPDC050795]|uniref:hypothetical protein n=1 Tax=Micromonospora sp. NPDC050795 TaxID=3364282 RepID=UPI00378F4F21
MAEAKSTTTKNASTSTSTRSGSKQLVVLAPLVQVRDAEGRIQYLYRGAVMPQGTPQAELDRLSEMGLIGEDDGTAVAGVAADPQG